MNQYQNQPSGTDTAFAGVLLAAIVLIVIVVLMWPAYLDQLQHNQPVPTPVVVTVVPSQSPAVVSNP